jgi:NAD(P)-dependent dehydrogenase (short-subunit alcohol dehydrogenase family)
VRTVVVLGASSGTGAAIVREAARRGFAVLGMHRGNHQDAADALERELAGSAAPVRLVRGDASLPESAAEGARLVRDTAGPAGVALFVHSLADASVGSFVRGPGAPLHPKQFDKTFRTMAHSFVFWAQELVAQETLAPGACLLALTNPFADSVCGGFGMVAAAKAALESYVRYLAFELGPLGVRVNLLKFGLVETPAVRRAFSDEAWAQAVERVSRVSPYGRVTTCDEVARFSVDLTSENAAWLNGATVDFSGGQAQSLLHYLFHHR